MDSEWITYFRLGASHIADWKGYDHILFIIALTAGFAAREWRRLLWLVTAFTLGHSVTLALATLRLVRVHAAAIELLIAITILVTAMFAIVSRVARAGASAQAASAYVPERHLALYAMAGAFGLIHGLGFSNFLRSVLGSEESIVVPLLAFNIGLEIGQLAIVASVLAIGWLLCDVGGLTRRRWVIALSTGIAAVSIKMIIDRVGKL